MTISTGISNLRYLYIDSKNDRIDIILDISKIYPSKLQLYYVIYH